MAKKDIDPIDALMAQYGLTKAPPQAAQPVSEILPPPEPQPEKHGPPPDWPPEWGWN